MARLLIKTDGIENRLIELKLGVNRIGRSPDTDFTITHPTVSSLHCEVVLMEEGVTIRDLESTNGTFVDGRPVREARLSAGQIVRLGDVELSVESTEFRVAIPKFVDMELPAPPVVMAG
jgi:pSer/pThr/pTyr-binding forkhead associated (FHA) protein